MSYPYMIDIALGDEKSSTKPMFFNYSKKGESPMVTADQFIVSTEDLDFNHTDAKNGIYTGTPVLVPRKSGASILALAVGDIVLVRCSSTIKPLIGREDFIPVGTIFTVTDEMAKSGSAPYIPASQGSSFVDPTSIAPVSSGSKAFLGAGKYIALNTADLTDNNSVFLCKKIGTVSE